jgi:hypothetical protein
MRIPLRSHGLEEDQTTSIRSATRTICTSTSDRSLVVREEVIFLPVGGGKLPAVEATIAA